MNRFRYCLWLGVVLGLATSVLRADDEPPPFENFKPRAAWQEQRIELPPYPRDDDLQRVPLQLSKFPFELSLDRASLTVGEDQVTRYTAMLESKDGVRNVFYEGIRCATREYRGYAVGASAEFQPLLNSEWRPISARGLDRYRHELARYYLCDEDLRPRSKRAALNQLRQRWQHEDHYF